MTGRTLFRRLDTECRLPAALGNPQATACLAGQASRACPLGGTKCHRHFVCSPRALRRLSSPVPGRHGISNALPRQSSGCRVPGRASHPGLARSAGRSVTGISSVRREPSGVSRVPCPVGTASRTLSLGNPQAAACLAGQVIRGLPARRDEVSPAFRLFAANPPASFESRARSARHLEPSPDDGGRGMQADSLQPGASPHGMANSGVRSTSSRS